MKEDSSDITIENTHEQMQQRLTKLKQLRAKANPYPNDFRRDHLAAKLHADYAEKTEEFFHEEPIVVKLAGRVMMRRLMGKAMFIHIQDMSGFF